MRSLHAFVVPFVLAACGGGSVDISSLPEEQPPPEPASDPGGSASSTQPPPQTLAPACADRNPLKNVYWGDLHVHTSYSLDSYTFGNRNDPKDAYAFARGNGTITIAKGEGGTKTVKIDRPLSFAAVTDHSEWLSITGECQLDPSGGRPYCDAYRNQGSAAQKAVLAAAGVQLAKETPTQFPWCDGANAATCLAAQKSAWDKLQQAAAAANEPCAFTSLVGYEWTASTGGLTHHRNVIFGSATVPAVPYDYMAYPTPLALWKALEAGCKPENGCDALTIPHNSNLSGGTAWDTADDPSALPYMMRYQTLVEIFQHKGASECIAGTLLGDPTCAFESKESTAADVPGMVRNGLAKGLEMKNKSGMNPLALGIIASTDTHNGSPGAVKEDLYQGHGGGHEDAPEDRLKGSNNPGGIAAVWATENTREAIFAGLKKKETYATSGPRIAVRFYAANVASDAAAQALCADPEFPKQLVAAGATPMGSVKKASSTPYFFVSAMKDATLLDEIDIVKISLGPLGNARATVKSFPLGAAGVGSACVFFEDPEADTTKPSVYYARVFEKPTWRWSHYDCALAPAACGEKDVKIRERAWTSPIFLEM